MTKGDKAFTEYLISIVERNGGKPLRKATLRVQAREVVLLVEWMRGRKMKKRSIDATIIEFLFGPPHSNSRTIKRRVEMLVGEIRQRHMEIALSKR